MPFEEEQELNEPIFNPVMDEEDAEKVVLREVSIKTMDFFKRGFRLLVQYEGNPVLAQHAMALAFEWYDLIECETAVEVAVKLSGNPKKKAAVTKAVKYFQDAMGIAPGKGQRSEKGRQQMTQARNKQFKPKGTK